MAGNCNKWEIGRPALPPHGATFHRRNLFDEPDPFDLRFAIAADSHFLLRQIRNHPPHFMPVTVTRSPLGGVSFRLDTARLVATEIATINRDLGGSAARSPDVRRPATVCDFNIQSTTTPSGASNGRSCAADDWQATKMDSAVTSNILQPLQMGIAQYVKNSAWLLLEQAIAIRN